MKRAFRALKIFIILVFILSGVSQLPPFQTAILNYATDIATESLGLDMDVGAVEIHLFQRTLTLSDLTCNTGGAEVLCSTLDLKYKGANSEGVSEFGKIRLDGVRFYADSLEQIYDAFPSDSTGEYSRRKMLFERFEMSNFEWQIGDSLHGHIALFALDSIVIESGKEMSEDDLDVNIGGYEIRGANTDFKGTNVMSVENTHGKGKLTNNEFYLTILDFKASGIQLQGELESGHISELEDSLAKNQGPHFDIAVVVHPNFIAPWANDEVNNILEALKTDELTGDVIYKDGALVVNNLSNSDVTISGSARNIGEEYAWNLNLDLKTSLLKPWTEDLKVAMQEKSPEAKKIADKIDSIHLSASGGTNNIEGTLAVSQDLEGGLSLQANYTLNWEEHGFDAGWESTFYLDSLHSEYGILKNLHAQINGEKGHVEVKWDNDILKAKAMSNRWGLYSRLNGFAEWNDDNRGGKRSASLNFIKPLLIQLKDGNTAGQAPIKFDRFNLDVAIHPEKNKNHTMEKGLLDVQVESDVMIGDATFSLDTEVWTEWLDLMIMRVDRENKSSVANTLLTSGRCKILRSEPISAILGTTLFVSQDTEFTWRIDNQKTEAVGKTDWIKFDDFQLNQVFLDFSGRTDENWINIEALELLKQSDIYAQDMNIDIHADTVWTADCGWKNFAGIEGIVSLEGLLEQKGSWGFDVYEATIPLGNDTLELTRIPSSLSLNSTEVSSDGMSWAGGGFKADIEGEIGGDSARPLNFLIHTDGIDTSRTKRWFNVPVSASNINLSGSLGGTLSTPVLRISGEGEGVSYGGETIPKSTFELTYSNRDIYIESDLTGFGDNREGIIHTSGYVTPLPLGDFNLNLMTYTTDFPLSWANTILNEKTAKLGGKLDAAFTIRGPYREPSVLGGGDLKKAKVKIEYLGTEYDVSGKFNVKPDGIELNGIDIKDNYGGQGVMVGTALHENYEKWNLDISMSIDDPKKPLEVMNIPRSSDAYFYGNANGIGDINVFGYEDKLYIEARLKTTKGTQFVLPMDAGTSSTWSSFVEIIDNSPQENIEEASIEENQSKTSVRLDLIIDVDQESEARIVFDEAVGDEIIGKCEGVIQLALDDFERLAMFGSLKVIEGEYLFTLSNFINKRFIAEPGGTIKWYGDPYQAEIDLRTFYSTRTTLLPIAPETLDNSKQKVDLILEMHGDLMRPGINFDIQLPEGDSRTKATLASLLANEEEMNRQAISLLILQQFLPPQWQAAAIGSTGLQENSTELISAQLGNWLSGLSDDVNIGIDYDAKNNSGNEAALAVALSTQLLNDRLHVEGELGTQQLNTGSLDDLQLKEFRVKYDLKDDGTLQLTGYSTQRANIPGLEGESVQGVGILLHRDFTRFKNLFGKRND